MAGLAAAGTARAMGAIVRGFDTRLEELLTVKYCLLVIVSSSPENTVIVIDSRVELMAAMAAADISVFYKGIVFPVASSQ